MKAKLQAEVVEISKNTTCKVDAVNYPNLVRLKFVCQNGRVDTPLNNAQQAILFGELFLKPAIVNQMKIGGNIVITISDEDTTNNE